MKFVKKPARLQATQKEKPGGGQMLFVFHVGRSAHCPPPETCSGEQKTQRKMMRMVMMVERSDQGEGEYYTMVLRALVDLIVFIITVPIRQIYTKRRDSISTILIDAHAPFRYIHSARNWSHPQ